MIRTEKVGHIRYGLAHRLMMFKNRRLSLEQLNERDVPTTWSVPWDDPSHLTVSFAPDGTDVGGSRNSLYADMKADGYTSPSSWQGTIFKALNTWSESAGLRFSQVYDWGSPFGTPGAVQGDIRFGDIRVASRPLTSNLAAMASPFTWTGSTWSGDIVLNSNAKFSSTGESGTYDLYSVVLHEAGHALGLDDNSDPTSVMCEDYKLHTTLSSADVKAIQSLYGSPLPSVTSPPPYSSLFIALSNAITNIYGQLSGTLTSKSQVDDHVVTAPQATSSAPMNLIVYVRAKNVSLGLTPQLAVYNSSNRSVPFEVISNSQGWVSIQVRNVTPGALYHLKVFDSQLGKLTMDYGMGIDFNQYPPVQRDLIAASTLSATNTTTDGTLLLKESRLMSFSLCSSWKGGTNVQMTVTDANGKVVAQLTCGPNALPPTQDVFLDAGTYQVRYRAFSPSGKKVNTVQFVAMLNVLNDPIGTYAPTATATTDTTMMASTTTNSMIATDTTTSTTTNTTSSSTDTSIVAPPPDYTYTGFIDPTINTVYLYYY